MTLIIGIKCAEGIVLGADGAATFQAGLGQPTIRQETTKLDIVEECIVVGVSGAVGLGQRIRDEIRSQWRDPNINLRERAPTEAMQILRLALWNKHILSEMQIAQQMSAMMGQRAALSTAIAHTVAALPLQGEPCLIQFDEQASPEEATDQLPFVAIGSGQPIADPFLAFLRRVMWPKGLPSLHLGIFSTLWTLEHAIRTNPGGVGDPKQIVVLEKTAALDAQGRPECSARQLAQAELDEHLEAIAKLEQTLAEFPRNRAAEGTPALQPPAPEPS